MIKSSLTVFAVIIALCSTAWVLNIRSDIFPAATTMLSVNFQVFGRVQGVFFRKYTKMEADKLRLTGSVRNEPDGTVSGILQGDDDMVQKMKRWLCEKGSPHSAIARCEFSNERQIEKSQYAAFTINR